MHVIIVSIGSQGDLYPLLGIGSALKAKGHQVTVLASSYFEPDIQKAGLSFFSIGSAQEFTNAIDILEDSNIRSLVFQHLYLRPMKPVYDYLSDQAAKPRSYSHAGNTQ